MSSSTSCLATVWRSADSEPEGLVTKSLAPRSRHSMVTRAPSFAMLERMMTGMSMPSFLRSCRNSSPFISGISMSSTMMSGLTRAIFCSAKRPFMALSAIWSPGVASIILPIRLRISAESSTIRTDTASICTSCQEFFWYRQAQSVLRNSNLVFIPNSDSECPMKRNDFGDIASQNRSMTAFWAASSK